MVALLLARDRIVPIINENNAVDITEIEVGDNDNLSVLVAILTGDNKLLLLTDQQGIYTSDPHDNPQVELICEV